MVKENSCSTEIWQMLSLLWGLIQGLLISWKRVNSIIILYTTIILIWFSQDKFCHLEADVPKFLGFTIARRVGQKSWAPVPIFFCSHGIRAQRNRCRISVSEDQPIPDWLFRSTDRSVGGKDESFGKELWHNGSRHLLAFKASSVWRLAIIKFLRYWAFMYSLHNCPNF